MFGPGTDGVVARRGRIWVERKGGRNAALNPPRFGVAGSVDM